MATAPKPQTCGLQPLAFNVIVRPDKVEEKTRGGILLPDSVVEKDKFAVTRATLVAMSPFAFSYATEGEWGFHPKPKVGDVVMLKRHAGNTIEIDGVEHKLLEDKEIIAVETN